VSSSLLIGLAIAFAAAAAITFAGYKALQRKRAREYVVREFPEFLSAEECEHIIGLARPRIFKSTIVNQGEYKEGSLSRTSSSAFLKNLDDSLVRRVKRRVAELSETDLRCQEPLQVTYYQKGQYYTPHFDSLMSGGLEMGESGDRYCTVIIYLNDDFEGGHTRFYKTGVRVKPERGKAVFFLNLTEDQTKHHPFSLHGAEPVTGGEKWLANQWIRLHPTGQAKNRKARRAGSKK